jgi:type II secretory pathway pseudopilin PulG
MPVKDRREDGFTMIMTVIGITLVVLLAAVAVTAVNGDTHLNSRDSSRKAAYEAALAGLNEYAYHLHSNGSYWAECKVNQRKVPEGDAEYKQELLGVNEGECDPTSITTATASMLETAEGTMKGTFRVRSVGTSGNAEVAVTATFKPASFLDYVYFTQLETSDPVTYGTEELINAANRQCTKTIRKDRYATPLENENGEYLTPKGTVTTSSSSADYCDTISFVGPDNIKGPMHTNDAFVICESPTLGRTSNDPIEVSAGEPGWYSTKDIPHSGSGCTGTKNNFKGNFRINSQELVPPETNSELETIAESRFHFSGEVKICLEETQMTVGEGPSCTANVLYHGAFPANGVIYVSSNSCSGAYSPFLLAYSTTVGTCGNVLVQGKYSKPLTIAAANDILITGNIEKSSESGMLGLIANNFIRIYHPIELVHPMMKVNCHLVQDRFGRWHEECEEVPNLSVTECNGNAPGALENLKIEAALLAIKHSIIVDNYNCGAKLGTLNVVGALAQKYRGAVGTTGSSGNGYLKNYEYDERLKTTEPPSFIEPIKSDWVIGRETTE